MRDRLATLLVNRYTVEEEIGRGGWAVVYRARDLRHDRPVALKVLRDDLTALIGAERFLAEIRITARLNHPHVLPLLDSGEADGLLYYAMPFIPGGSLRDLLEREGRCSLDATARLVEQVASALEHAHRESIVHRDVKPENILLSEGLATVSDFGVARAISALDRRQLTSTGLHVGTLGYMSPEQAAGATDLDGATDEFALAAVAYEMLVGETPRRWMTDEAVRMGRFFEAEPVHREALDALPGRVEQVLVRGMALNPRDRLGGPGAFADALADAAKGGREVPDDEAREIVRRATELELAGAAETHALTMGGVEQVAAQVGLPPEQVRRAANEVAAGRELTVSNASARPRGERVQVDRVAACEADSAVHPSLVDAIQSSLGIVGHVSSVGRTLTWSPAATGVDDRKIVVTLTPKDGVTRVHVEERFELAGVRMMLPAGGAFLAMVFVMLVATFLGLASSTWATLPLVLGGVAGAFLTVNGYLTARKRRSEPELGMLADRLTALIEGTTSP
jgi:hypothetical protein